MPLPISRQLSAVLFLLATSPALSEEAPNPSLLENGDFEADAPGTVTIGKMPTGWVKSFGPRVLAIVSETRPGSKGTQCLKIGTSEKVRTGGAYSDLAPIDPEKGLRITGWLKSGKPKAPLRGLYFGIGWYDQSRKPIILRKGTTVNYHYISNKVKRGDWYQLSAAFLPTEGTDKSYYYQIPPEARFFDIRIFALNFPAPAWYDDIEVTTMSDEETTELREQTEKERQAAAKAKSRSGTKPRLPADLNAEWLVGWRGTDDVQSDRKAQGAADELATYINKVLGKPVSSVKWQPNKAKNVFVVMQASNAPKEIAERLKDKRADAFVIRYPVEYEGQKVCLMVSQDADGHDRPIYYFLTKFMDIHWVGPGELGEVFDPKPDWTMPATIDVLENPDFEMRHWYSPSFTCRQWLAAGVRMDFHHALGRVFSPDKHGDTPEVYPLVKGRRFVPEKRGGHYLGGWQPCTANPKSIEIATRHVLDRFEKNPMCATVSLSVNDGAGNVCECELCRAQDGKNAFQPGKRPDLSDRFFRFYNAVIARAAEMNPSARLAVLGYGAVKTPPKETRVDPRICVFHVCPSEEKLRAWKEAGASPNLYTWLWDGGFLMVRPDLESMARIIREAHRLGGIGFYAECIPHWIISAPKFYVIAHFLWDTTRDPDKLLDRYFELAYGEAAPHVRAYFDHWFAIYRRYPPEEHYHTSLGWRSPQQLENLHREDLPVLAAALKRASESELTEKQRKRLEFLRSYHQIMHVNAEEYLAGQELTNEKWLAENSTEAILTLAEHTTSLTPRFDELYRTHVLEDTTGWMVDAKYYQDTGKFYSRFVAQLRNTVSSNASTAIDGAVAFIVRNLLKGQMKEEAVSFLESQIKKRPLLESYLGPKINQLRGVTHPNIVANGGFEEGEPGDPPKLPSWDFYQFYGMVKGVSARHDWKAGNGRNGGKAIGLGEGRYPEMKAIIEMEKGRRYEISFWYRSDKRERNSSFTLFGYEGDITSPSEIKQEKIQTLQAIQLEPTDGQWKQFRSSIKPSRSGKYIIQLAVYYQKKDWWAWFDDVEIRRLW